MFFFLLFHREGKLGVVTVQRFVHWKDLSAFLASTSPFILFTDLFVCVNGTNHTDGREDCFAGPIIERWQHHAFKLCNVPFIHGIAANASDIICRIMACLPRNRSRNQSRMLLLPLSRTHLLLRNQLLLLHRLRALHLSQLSGNHWLSKNHPPNHSHPLLLKLWQRRRKRSPELYQEFRIQHLRQIHMRLHRRLRYLLVWQHRRQCLYRWDRMEYRQMAPLHRTLQAKGVRICRCFLALILR